MEEGGLRVVIVAGLVGAISALLAAIVAGNWEMALGAMGGVVGFFYLIRGRGRPSVVMPQRLVRVAGLVLAMLAILVVASVLPIPDSAKLVIGAVVLAAVSVTVLAYGRSKNEG